MKGIDLKTSAPDEITKFFKETEIEILTGAKVIFKGVPEFYYPMFTNVGEDARKFLEVGKEYIVTKHEIYSSWQSFELEGIPGFYHKEFFKLV